MAGELTFDDTHDPPVNGRIESTMLGIEHGFMLTFWVNVEQRNAGQGIGGYCLAHESKPGGFGKGFDAILNLLKTVGVDKWESLKGQLIRIRWAKGGLGSATPPVIGNIIDDRWWFCPDELK